MNDDSNKLNITKEAKALVALAFRNGPIESVHAGKACPTCDGQPGYGRITQDEMKGIMKSAVDQLYRILCLKSEDPRMYESEIRRGAACSAAWDEPAGAPIGSCSGTDSVPPSEVPTSAVLVIMPLRRTNFNRHRAAHTYSFEEARNRMEDIVGWIGFRLRDRGIASAYEFKADKNGLKLLLVGADVKAIQAEILAHLHFFQLPNSSRMIVFTEGAPQPDEIRLN